MRIIITICLVFLLSFIGCGSNDESNGEGIPIDINGTWDFTFYDIPDLGTTYDPGIVITHTGSSGTFHNPSTGNTYNIRIHGTSVSSQNIEYLDGFFIDMIGTASETEMSGTWSMEGFTGTWKGQKI